VRAGMCVCLKLTGTISLTYAYDDASPTQPPIAIGLLPLWVRPVGDESARVCI